MKQRVVRRILPSVKDFKAFWKKQGPFKYALTSAEFPPVLLEPEEWIFSDDIILLLKDLMQWESREMAIVKAPFNRKRKNVLKPEMLIPWKIENFPQEWECAVCDTFTPVGYLTEAVTSEISLQGEICNTTADVEVTGEVEVEQKTREVEQNAVSIEQEITAIENAFFQSLEANIDKIGYLLLKPEPLLEKYEEAYIDDYLQEWQADEDEG